VSPRESKALNKTGVSPASLVSLEAKSFGQPRGTDRQKVYEAQKTAVSDIGGLRTFSSSPRRARRLNEHTVLISSRA